MSVLGIYFGPKVIGLVETEGRKLLNYVSFEYGRVPEGEQLDEKVPEHIKMAMLLKEELRKNSIQAKSANLMLPGKDLIIRTFHMPMLPAAEMLNAVRFEAKKYIPFKVEDLFSDYQVTYDKALRKNFVLFVGIKKENLDRYLSAVNHVGLKINDIEYAGFGILRLLKAAKVQTKGVQALVNVDLTEEDEVNFVVLEDGLPLFSRDITLAGEAPLGPGTGKQDFTESLEKLKIELRISLDFYLRKFPTKNIRNVLFVAREEHRGELESFIKERGLQAKFVETRKLFEKPVSFSASFMKAYSASVAKTIRNQVVIDLFPAKTQKKTASRGPAFGGLSMMPQLHLDFRFILLGALCVALPHVLNVYLKKPEMEKLEAAKSARPAVSSVSPEDSYETLVSANTKYGTKIKSAKDLLRARKFFTAALDSLPRAMTKGVWLKSASFSQDNKGLNLSLRGSAYLGDTDKEREAVEGVVGRLRKEKAFSSLFPDISFSIEQGKDDKTILTNFTISCRGK